MDFNGFNGGSRFGNGNGDGQKKLSMFTPYRFNNPESNIDQTTLAFGYWNRMLKMTIAPKRPQTNPELPVTYDMEAGITVFLSFSKAKMLAEELKKYLENPNEFETRGIPTGKGLILISNGQEYGYNGPVLTIRKTNETGMTVSAYAYQFKTDYYYAIKNYKDDGTFLKDTAGYEFMEVNMVIDLLEKYYIEMTYATSYVVNDQMQFTGRMMDKIDAIMSAVGAQVRNKQPGFNSASVFNNAGVGMNMGSGASSSNSEPPFDTSGDLDDAY